VPGGSGDPPQAWTPAPPNGQSPGAANGGVCTSGITEARDVVGSIEYVRSRPGTQHMPIDLFSPCMGGSPTFRAMQRYAAAFDGIRCLVSPQPVTTRLIVERRLGLMGLAAHLERFNTYVRLRTSVGLEERVPQEWAKSVSVPTLLYQVRADSLTHPSDVQAMFDNIPVADKRLFRIEGTTAPQAGENSVRFRPRPPGGKTAETESVEARLTSINLDEFSIGRGVSHVRDYRSHR